MVHSVMPSCCRGFSTAVRYTGYFTLQGMPKGDLTPIIKRSLFYSKRRQIFPIVDANPKEINPLVYFSMGLGLGFMARKTYSEFKGRRPVVGRQESIGSEPTSYISSGKFKAKGYAPIPPKVFRDLIGTPCLVNSHDPISDLVYVTATHYDLRGRVHVGEMIIHNSVAEELMAIFQELYVAKVGVEITPIEKYGSHELRLGVVIDINGPNIKDPDSFIVLAFKERGFTWGGDREGLKDYQHFEIDPKQVKNNPS